MPGKFGNDRIAEIGYADNAAAPDEEKTMETANLVTYSHLWQVIAIFAGTSFAYFSLVISLVVRWYIHDTNRRDQDYHRRFQEMEEANERRFREIEEANERRFAEIDRRFQAMEEANERRFAEIDRRFQEMEEANERRFVEIDRRFREMEEANERRFVEIDRRFREMEEANERRHQELLKAIGALYHHVHADGSPAIVPMPGIDPATAPTPADN